MPFLIYPFVVTIGPVCHDMTWQNGQVNIYFSFIFHFLSFSFFFFVFISFHLVSKVSQIVTYLICG